MVKSPPASAGDTRDTGSGDADIENRLRDKGGGEEEGVRRM